MDSIAQITSDLVPGPSGQYQHYPNERPSLLNDETRGGLASVVSTLRARMAAPAPSKPPTTDEPGRGVTSHTASPQVTPRIGASPPGSHGALPSPTPSIIASIRNRPLMPPASTQLPQIANGSYAAPSTPASNPPHQNPPATNGPLPGTGNHRSPTVGSSGNGVETSSEYLALAELVTKTDASIVRQVIRDHWQKCVMGSEFHYAFLANTLFYHGKPEIISRSIKDFGEQAVRASRRPILRHFTPQDLDEAADVIHPKLSNWFLDKAMSIRLETIGAQDLVNALARAERLGYDVHDIVEKVATGEHVIPSLHAARTLPPPPAHGQHYAPGPHQDGRHLPPPAPRQQNTAQNGHAPDVTYEVGTRDIRPAPPHPSTQTPRQLQHPPPDSPSGLVFCDRCNRPCSSTAALTYHLKKVDCLNPDVVNGSPGRDTCIHCGSRFSSSGGLNYHVKSDVCGVYLQKTADQMLDILKQCKSSQPSQPNGGTVPYVAAPASQYKPATELQRPRTFTPASRSNGTPSSGNDPYAKLTPDERVRFEAEMRQVEEHYGKLMRDAMNMHESVREEELGKLKNRYNTKQSMTRKKYGIRLRERRSAAEIEAERARLQALTTPSSNRGPAIKRARIDAGGQGVVTQPAGPSESPRKRVPVSEMGGLSGSSATAELVDPTASLTPSKQRYGDFRPPSAGGTAPAQQPPSSTTPQGTSADPMRIDSDESNSESNDEDIPSKVAPAAS